MRAQALIFSLLFVTGVVTAQDVAAGRKQFESRCAGCHGGDGTGGELGPPIVGRLQAKTDDDLTALMREGLPDKGMPGFKLNAQENGELLTFLRSLRPRRGFNAAPIRGKAELVSGKSLEGL